MSQIAARERCIKPNHPSWKYYGGRGIKFCFSTFEEFIAEVGRRPRLGLTIDRINNDGNYEVGNLRWATRKEQAQNKRKGSPPKGMPWSQARREAQNGR